jgi:hypothetical protein
MGRDSSNGNARIEQNTHAGIGGCIVWFVLKHRMPYHRREGDKGASKEGGREASVDGLL